MQQRIFYVTFLEKEPLCSGIDAIRLIANPFERLRTHITLRGPYKKRGIRFPRLNQKLIKSEIAVYGVGCFFVGGQNTVFWDAHGDTLNETMNKKDYPTGKPHLTIYDGNERSFATRLHMLFANRDVSFNYNPSMLRPVFSIGKQTSMDIWSKIDKAFVSRIVDFDFCRSKVLALNSNERFEAINLILDMLIQKELIYSRTLPGFEKGGNMLAQEKAKQSGKREISAELKGAYHRN